MRRIDVKGFKSIKRLELDLRPINILIGANGSGKSNFLSLFDFIKNLYKGKLQEYVALQGGMDKFLHHGTKFTNEISASIFFENESIYSFNLKNGNEKFIVSQENFLISDGENIRNIIFNDFTKESALENLDDKDILTYIKESLQSLVRYHFNDTNANSPFSKDSHIDNDAYLLYENGQNIAAFLYNIYKNDQSTYKLILKLIQSVAPYFNNFVFRPNQNGYINLQWESKFSDIPNSVNYLSDGTLRFIALLLVFMQENLPQTIIIDEPELGLHPTAIAKLAGLIKSASDKNCQIIIATQSTELISHFLPEDIITVDQINGESQFKRLDSESLSDWLQEYTIDDLWRREIIFSGQVNA